MTLVQNQLVQKHLGKATILPFLPLVPLPGVCYVFILKSLHHSMLSTIFFLLPPCYKGQNLAQTVACLPPLSQCLY